MYINERYRSKTKIMQKHKGETLFQREETPTAIEKGTSLNHSFVNQKREVNKSL